jgi:hypothetical protein
MEGVLVRLVWFSTFGLVRTGPSMREWLCKEEIICSVAVWGKKEFGLRFGCGAGQVGKRRGKRLDSWIVL